MMEHTGINALCRVEERIRERQRATVGLLKCNVAVARATHSRGQCKEGCVVNATDVGAGQAVDEER